MKVRRKSHVSVAALRVLFGRDELLTRISRALGYQSYLIRILSAGTREPLRYFLPHVPLRHTSIGTDSGVLPSKIHPLLPGKACFYDPRMYEFKEKTSAALTSRSRVWCWSVDDGIGCGCWDEPNHSNTRVGGGPREERDVRAQGTAPAY